MTVDAPVRKAHISCGRGIACLLSWCVLQASPTELSGSETEWSDSETIPIIEISDDEEAQLAKNHLS
jgi:hypothetical protein